MIARANRSFSSGSDKASFRSPVASGFKNGEAVGEGRLDRNSTTFTTSDLHTLTPHGDTDGTASGLRQVPEDGKDHFNRENANFAIAGLDTKMAQDIMVTFLGTSSGGGPTKTRNCSSLVVDMLGDGSLWSAYCSSN